MGYSFGLKLVVIRFLKNKNSSHTPYDRDYSPGLSVVFSCRAILPWGLIFSEVGSLVRPQLTIMISFDDLVIVWAVVLGLMNFVAVAYRDVKFRDQVSVSRLFETKFSWSRSRSRSRGPRSRSRSQSRGIRSRSRSRSRVLRSRSRYRSRGFRSRSRCRSGEFRARYHS